jgi:hypothetical protein
MRISNLSLRNGDHKHNTNLEFLHADAQPDEARIGVRVRPHPVLNQRFDASQASRRLN